MDKKKDKLFVCPSCMFITDDITELHKVIRFVGAITHLCPHCRDSTGMDDSRLDESSKQRKVRIAEKFDLIILNNKIGHVDSCTTCQIRLGNKQI